MKQVGVKAFSINELALFWYNNFIFANAEIGIILMLRINRTYPSVLFNHGINGREINHLAIAFGFARSEFIGFFKLCVQFRTSLFNIGLIEIEHVIDLKFRIHCYVLLLLIGHLLVIIVLNLLMTILIYTGKCRDKHRKAFLTFIDGD